ncbi:MAG: transporter substrate-binding domain-containing protein [Alphaproteobacteria bacterium]|nr:transporter substrate-binding domain-containing protein [Alphaproteobacteria bacterium]
MRFILATVLVLLASAVLAQQVKPPQTPPAPPPAPSPQLMKLRVIVDLSEPHFAVRAPNGRLAGFDIDLLQALCARLRADCIVEAVDWDDLRADIAAGKADLAAGGIEIGGLPSERSVFAAAYGRVPLAIAVRKGTKLEVSAAGLKDKRIAVQRSTRWARWLKDAGVATVVELETPEDVRAALSAGKADGALLDRRQTATWLASPAGACCELAKPDIRDAGATGPGVAFLLRSDIKLKELVEKAMAGLRDDGTIQRLAAKHLPFPLM